RKPLNTDRQDAVLETEHDQIVLVGGEAVAGAVAVLEDVADLVFVDREGSVVPGRTVAAILDGDLAADLGLAATVAVLEGIGIVVAVLVLVAEVVVVTGASQPVLVHPAVVVAVEDVVRAGAEEAHIRSDVLALDRNLEAAGVADADFRLVVVDLDVERDVL